MGSLNHSSIPVVGKTSNTLRTDGRRITSSDSNTDLESVEVLAAPAQVIGSGSYVGANGVQYFTNVPFGLLKESRLDALVVARSVVSDHLEVIPDGQPTNAQYGIRQEGSYLTNSLSITDAVIERISNSGVV